MKCNCGRETKDSESNNFSTIMKETGFFPIMGWDENITWVCGECAIKLGKLAKEIAEIIGIDKPGYIYFSSLLKFSK